MIRDNCYFICKIKDHGATLTYCDNAYRNNCNLPLKSCNLCKYFITKEKVDVLVYRYLELNK